MMERSANDFIQNSHALKPLNEMESEWSVHRVRFIELVRGH